MGKQNYSREVLVVSQLVNSTRGGILAPIMPFFIYELSNRSFFLLSLANNVSLLVTLVLSPVMGMLIDKTGRRKVFILFSTCVGILLGFLTSFVDDYIQYILINLAGAVVGVAGGLAFTSLMADVFDKKSRGKLLGLYNAVGLAGGILGNILSAYVYQVVGVRGAIRIVSLTGLVTLLLYASLKDDRRPIARSSSITLIDSLKSFKDKGILRLFALKAPLQLPGILASGVFAIYFTEVLGGTPELWALLGAVNTAVGLTSIPYGYLVDRMGRKRMLYFSAVGWTILYLGYLFSRDPLTFSIFFVIPIWPAFNIAYTSMLFDITEGENRTRLLGAMNSLNSIYTFTFSMLGGIIADLFEPRLVFLIALIPLSVSIPVIKLLAPDDAKTNVS